MPIKFARISLECLESLTKLMFFLSTSQARGAQEKLSFLTNF